MELHLFVAVNSTLYSPGLLKIIVGSRSVATELFVKLHEDGKPQLEFIC